MISPTCEAQNSVNARTPRLEGGEIQPDRAEDVEAREHQDEDGRAPDHVGVDAGEEAHRTVAVGESEARRCRAPCRRGWPAREMATVVPRP